MTEDDINHLWDNCELDENELKITWIGAQYYAFQCTQCDTLLGYWDMD